MLLRITCLKTIPRPFDCRPKLERSRAHWSTTKKAPSPRVAHELGLTNVFFTGWLPHDLLSKGLNLADVFVAPSYYEPFGQVFLEAMATGLPVIAARSGGPTSFVVDTGPAANGWFSEVDDVQSLAQIIYQALTGGAQRRRRGDNALELARKDYSWRGIAGRYVTAYGQMID